MVPHARVGLDLYEVPKPGGGVRVITVLDPPTARRYAELVASATPAGRFGPDRAFGVGIAPGHLPGERARWARAVSRAVGLGAAVGSDVRACFPSIGAEAVDVALSSARVDARDVASLQALLREISLAGTPGLPIGPTPSGALAETVLRVGDAVVRRSGGTIVRWVDDVVIAGPDRIVALRAFDAWARCLRELGLEPHDGKTHLLEGSSMPGTPSGLLPSSRGMMRAP